MPPTSRLQSLGIVLVAITLAGCESKSFPDPNDPAQVGQVQPDVLMRNLRWASETVNQRVQKGEISEARGRMMLRDYAADLTKHIKLDSVAIDKAWEYAEVFRTAQQWENARLFYQVAVENPANEDRRVNDTLRYAQVLAHLGEVELALKAARSVFDAQPKDRAPLIPSLIFELAPAAQGKGFDQQLAQLISDALPLYDATVVDANTESGEAFLIAKPHLMREALKLIQTLRGSANPPTG